LAYEDVHLSWLTDEIERIGGATNGFLIPADKPGIRSRTENEMPELMASARKLIAILNGEYPK
jgi:hypothetical protein